jgi:hypothetical protein
MNQKLESRRHAPSLGGLSIPAGHTQTMKLRWVQQTTQKHNSHLRQATASFIFSTGKIVGVSQWKQPQQTVTTNHKSKEVVAEDTNRPSQQQ